MENLKLNAEIRTTEEKLSDVRSSKMVPAVVYGKHQEPILVKIEYSDFLRTFRKSGESHIINLNVGGNSIEVLVHEVQKEPISGDFLHIDFFAITKGEKVHTKIHLHFVGVSQAVKEGAILEEHVKELEVKVLPRDLVDAFDVDISVLKEMGDSIKISELNIDTAKYEILTPDTVVVAASKPAKIEIEEPTSTEEAATPEA
ncbi:MAG: 50S ribosomal protein L25 [Candidatus Gracilibacteria bacterium]|nr:50S ribosomal protein L25 [Candidatus Gracilibacteria bacterium]